MPFRGVFERRGTLIRGSQGWGEFSPFPGYSQHLHGLCLKAALASARAPWPPPLRESIPVHATIPAVGPLDAVQILKSSGCSAAKVKVAEGDDEARLEAIRDALGPGGRITIDANGAWDVPQAMEAIRVLRRYGIDLVEQPVATVEEMKDLRRRIDIPIAADESAATPDQAEEVALLEAADVLVLKVQHMGGVAEALKVVESTGLPAIVSSLIETSVGLSAGIALAAALPELDYPCGLATASLLESDVVANPLLPVDGRIQVRRPDVDLVGAARLLLDCDHQP